MDLLSSLTKDQEYAIYESKRDKDSLSKVEKEKNRHSKINSKKSKFDSNNPHDQSSINIFNSLPKTSKTVEIQTNCSRQLIKNSNFSQKILPFFQDSKEIKDTNDSWVYSDSKFSMKLGDNSSRPKVFLNKFNDSILN